MNNKEKPNFLLNQLTRINFLQIAGVLFLTSFTGSCLHLPSNILTLKEKTNKNIEIPESLINQILNPENWDKKTKTILGNAIYKNNKLIPIFENDTNNPEYPNLLSVGLSNWGISSTNRIVNIKNAIKKLNGTIIQSEEIFSFLNTIGPITSKTGFVESKVINNGKIVKGMGGGICQTPTTLFRAVYNAGLEIKQKQHHSIVLPKRYGKFGFDATISNSSSIDFKFKNNTNNPIQLICITKNSNLIFMLYGTKDRDVIVKNTKSETDWKKRTKKNNWKRKIYLENNKKPSIDYFVTNQKI